MTTRDVLLDVMEDLANALEDHHKGLAMARPQDEVRGRDRQLLVRSRYILRHAGQPKNMYLDALNAVQIGACNSSGLINSLAEWLPQIWADVDKNGNGGTSDFNRHPVVQLIASQLVYLAGLHPGLDTSDAEAKAETLAEEFEAAREKEGV